MTSTNHRATTRKDYGNHHRDLSGRPNFSTSDYNDQKSSYFSEQLARLDKKNNSRKHASSPSDLKEVASRNYRKYSREYSEDSEYSENSENYSDSYSNSEREERYHKSHNKSSKKENQRVLPSKKSSSRENRVNRESRENSRVLPSKNSSKISRREKSQNQRTLPSDSSKYLPSVSTPTYSVPELSSSPLKETKTKTTEENKEEKKRRKRRRKTDFEKFDKAEEQDPSFKHDRYEKKGEKEGERQILRSLTRQRSRTLLSSTTVTKKRKESLITLVFRKKG